jgi:hypothetical protein
MARIALPQPNEAMTCIAPRFLVPQPNGKQPNFAARRFFGYIIKIQNGPLLIGF